MHKLHRPAAPPCLRDYNRSYSQWPQVVTQDKAQIWHKLDEMQQQRCAYCEAHIETS